MAGEPTLYRRNQSAGGWVACLQRLLEGTGWLPTNGAVDGANITGLFNEVTFAAATSFTEEMEPKKRDGIVGDETWAALLSEGEPYPDPGDDWLALAPWGLGKSFAFA